MEFRNDPGDFVYCKPTFGRVASNNNKHTLDGRHSSLEAHPKATEKGTQRELKEVSAQPTLDRLFLLNVKSFAVVASTKERNCELEWQTDLPDQKTLLPPLDLSNAVPASVTIATGSPPMPKVLVLLGYKPC